MTYADKKDEWYSESIFKNSIIASDKFKNTFFSSLKLAVIITVTRSASWQSRQGSVSISLSLECSTCTLADHVLGSSEDGPSACPDPMGDPWEKLLPLAWPSPVVAVWAVNQQMECLCPFPCFSFLGNSFNNGIRKHNWNKKVILSDGYSLHFQWQSVFFFLYWAPLKYGVALVVWNSRVCFVATFIANWENIRSVSTAHLNSLCL